MSHPRNPTSQSARNGSSGAKFQSESLQRYLNTPHRDDPYVVGKPDSKHGQILSSEIDSALTKFQLGGHDNSVNVGQQWPYQLQQHLNTRQRDKPYVAGNLDSNRNKEPLSNMNFILTKFQSGEAGGTRSGQGH